MSTGSASLLRAVSVTAVLMAGVVAPAAAPRPAAAFCESPGGDGREDDELCHGRIVRAAVLPFLRHSVAHELDEYILVPDTNSFPDFYQAQSDLHFDSCNFDGGADTINDNYYGNIPERLTLPSPFYGRPRPFPRHAGLGLRPPRRPGLLLPSNFGSRWRCRTFRTSPTATARSRSATTRRTGTSRTTCSPARTISTSKPSLTPACGAGPTSPSEWGRVPSRPEHGHFQHDLPDGWSSLSRDSRTRRVVNPTARSSGCS